MGSTMRVKVNQHHADLSAGEVQEGQEVCWSTSLCSWSTCDDELGDTAREMQGVGHWLDSIQLLCSTVCPDCQYC